MYFTSTLGLRPNIFLAPTSFNFQGRINYCKSLGCMEQTTSLLSMGALHGTNDITSRVNYCKSLGCMEQTTSLLLWALHGTSNITSRVNYCKSLGYMEQTTSLLLWTLHGTSNITSRVNHCKSLGCMEQATSLQESIIVSPWDAWNKQHRFKSQLL